MELRRAADALLRSQGSLASVLNPSITVRWLPSRQLGFRCSSRCQSQRHLSTATRRNALRPSVTTTLAPPPPPPPESEQPTSEYKPSPLDSATKQEDTVKSITDAMGWAKRAARPSSIPSNNLPRPFQPQAWADGALSTSRESRLNGGSTASDLVEHFKKTRMREKLGVRSSPELDLSRMLDPAPPGSAPLSATSMLSDVHGVSRTPKPIRAPIKLGPSTGRSITIGAGIDVGRGFRLLEQSCARNKVRKDANMQRFHERAGLKRKRLRRERWRSRFLQGFKATVARVKQLKNQGW